MPSASSRPQLPLNFTKPNILKSTASKKVNFLFLFCFVMFFLIEATTKSGSSQFPGVTFHTADRPAHFRIPCVSCDPAGQGAAQCPAAGSTCRVSRAWVRWAGPASQGGTKRTRLRESQVHSAQGHVHIHAGIETGPPDRDREGQGQPDPSFLSGTKQGFGTSRLLMGPSMELQGTRGVCL